MSKCPSCGYENHDNPLVCALCGQLFRKSGRVARLVASGAGAASAVAVAPDLPQAVNAPFRYRAPDLSALDRRRPECESATNGGWVLVALGLLALAWGVLMLLASDALDLGASAYIQCALGLVFMGLGIGAVAGARICFRIGFWIYAIDTALFVIAVFASGAIFMVGALVVRVSILVWLSNQYRSM